MRIYNHEEEPRVMRLTDKQVEEARKVIAAQASTAPEDGDLSPQGALKRASGLRGATGHPINTASLTLLGFPRLNAAFEYQDLSLDAYVNRGGR